jgi:Uma2 family endonuclease
MAAPPAIARPAQAPASEPGQARPSYEEWLASDREGGLSEWIEGQVVTLMPAKPEHQRIVVFLSTLLNLFARVFGLGIVSGAPLTMRIAAGANAREPDVIYLSADHQARMTDTHLEGPADLVVEVVSDESVTRDRDDKFFEYEDGGVREYWIVDPRPKRRRADFYVLDAAGRYRPVPVGDDGIYHSLVLPGFWLKVDWLWEEDCNPLQALAEMAGVEKLVAAMRPDK